MVLGDDSPLRRLPEAMLPKQAMLFNGIRFCGEVVLSCMPSLRSSLLQIATTGEAGASAPAVMTLAWSVVDAVNRMRMLLQEMDSSGWVTRSDGFLSDLTTLEGARRVRNALQHLDERIDKHSTGESVPPVWGSLRWFAFTELDDDGTLCGGESCVLVPGSVMTTAEIGLANPIGQEFRSVVDEIGVEMFGEAVSISELERAVERVIHRLESSLREQVDASLPTRGADLLVMVSMRGDPETPEIP